MNWLAAELDRHQAQISLMGRFWARVWDLGCVLELHLNELGCTEGWFEADGQRLEVSGDAPGLGGKISGLIRAANLTEPFALFTARDCLDGVLLELGANGDDGSFERVVFVRLM